LKKEFGDFFVFPYIKKMETKKIPKIPGYFSCDKCDIICSHKGDWNKHILTAKHQKLTFGNDWKSLEIKKSPKKDFSCDCGKNYATNSGLWKHQKICNFKHSENNDATKTTPDIVAILLNQNQEFKELLLEQNRENKKLQQQLIEIAKEGKTTNTNCNNNNNNTNNFNLHFFLNEQCKDALNITDFINQLKLKLTDLDMVGKVGYSEGISQIFIRGLKELDVFKRPIHCSDLKREVLYVKDKDSWEKDNEDKNKMKTAIKYIAAKNFKQIHDWQEENPDSDDYDSKKHMDYHNIVINSMGGSNEEEDERNYNKIIKNVAKEVIIEKDKRAL
jgi:hypothetical protein